LVRLRVGPFDVREALDLDELQAVAAGNQWDSVLMPVDLLSPGAPVLVVDEPRASDYLAGRNWPAASDSKVTAPAHVLSPHGDWLGFGELTEAGRWQPRRAPVTSGHENYA
jgi:tRNA U55 pseudouridine synthase TruB